MKALKRIVYRGLCVCLMLLVLCTGVGAYSPYYTFTYDLKDKAVAAPEPVRYVEEISGKSLGLSDIKEPADICAGKDGTVYIADKGNNRILLVDERGGLITVVDGFDNQGQRDAFNGPAGLCLAPSGLLYISDSMNARIVCLDENLNLVAIYGAPQANALDESFHFEPTRIGVDSIGRMFVVSEGFHLGLLQLDEKGNFVRIFGAQEVEYDFSALFWKAISTKDQKSRSLAAVPTEYSGVCIDGEDFVYACSSDFDSTKTTGSGSVKKLNSLGKDILEEQPDFSLNANVRGTYPGAEKFVDVSSLGSQIYALLDGTRGRVYVYNDKADFLFEFGGVGKVRGTLGTPKAMEYANGKFYLCDSMNNCVSVFSLTDYGRNFLKAASLHEQNDDQGENQVWKEIYKANNNNVCAIRNMGRTCYREGDYQKAMAFFYQADDREGYSEAYGSYRKDLTNAYFVWIVLGLAAALILGVALCRLLKRREKKERDIRSFPATLGYAKRVVFHPMSGFWDMKRERYGGLRAAGAILAAVTVFYTLSDCLGGFIFNGSSQGKNFLLSMLTVLIPFFLFVVCNWCVASLMEGEGSFGYIFMGASYALSPLALGLPLLWLLSHVLTQEEGGLYALILAIFVLWSGFLIVCSNMEVHAYSMGKTLLVLLITLLVMLIVVFLCALIFALSQEIIGAIKDLYHELYLRF